MRDPKYITPILQQACGGPGSSTIGSLFAGIGGLELGLEWAGLGPVLWQVELDPFCRAVLERHWPGVARYGDIREIETLPYVDIICGGFPCQDISDAGLRAGIAGERSGLWAEFARLIRVVRPRFVVVENVSALLGRGLGRVLRDLSESGYDAEWSVLSACAVGAPHMRERLFIVAYAHEGDGTAGVGPVTTRPRTIQNIDNRASSWRDRVDRAMETAGLDDRNADGVSGPMVGALGNAVVPQVAEVIGYVIQELSRARRGEEQER